MSVITREMLIAALENIYGKRGMVIKDIQDLSDFLLSFFGYEDYVLDNVLSSSERDVFYNLEEFGLLEAHREEVSIIKGKSWRVNQWTYKKDNIKKAGVKGIEDENEENPYEEIFRELEDQKQP
ncbi:MAG: hypothetical protein M1151_01840 [Candidatus Thermoplasmatota archaeon]|jgi:hypothetical protein|nr:hypothetical protein [Candidatus Thermoplasmatota archaeon]MCL5785395.1 hypothetical protein [Candidatus Thermoplasmatota archaeon]